MTMLTDKIRSNLFDDEILEILKRGRIKAHNGLASPISSQASCLNFWYPFTKPENKEYLIKVLQLIGINASDIITIGPNWDFSGTLYRDYGNVIFEWIGPEQSPIGEENGYMRGHHRTSIDAYILAIVDGKVTQLLIEWKFTEHYSSKSNTGKFLGGKGVERLSRYSPIIARDRKAGKDILFNFSNLDDWGLYDVGYEPFYQLLRQHMLGQETLGMNFGPHEIEDYIVVHLSHSKNTKLNILNNKNCTYTNGLKSYVGKELHYVWKSLLNKEQQSHFKSGYWDNVLRSLEPPLHLKNWYIQMSNYFNII